MNEDNKDWKRNITLFLASQTISLLGSSLVQYAIMWHITLKTQSGLMMTISIICGFLPTFFLAPFAGVWADRFDRKKLIILSDSMIAFTTLILAILFLSGYGAIWLLFAASAVRAFGAAVQMPAVGALIPQIVPESKLTRVNGINGSIQAAIMIVSPILSGALLTASPIEHVFFIDVATASVGVLTLLMFLDIPPHRKALDTGSMTYYADLKMGFMYIRDHAYVRAFFTFCALFYFMISPAAFLTPLQVARSFGEDVWRLVAIEICFSSGMMAGGALIASWGGMRNRVHTMAVSGLAMGACTAGLGLTGSFTVYLAVMTVFGLALPSFNTPAIVLLQENVDEDYMGRVFGVMTMISSSMMPLGMLVFGPVSDIIDIEVLLMATGAILIVQSALLSRNKVLLKAGEKSVR